MKQKEEVPEISIIIPCYNLENVVKTTVKNILENLEKYTDSFEILIVNDGSTDNTLKVIQDIKGLVSHHKKFENERFELEYDIDGLVYKIDDLELQKRLGFTSNAPRWAIAHKFSANSAYSQILKIEIQIVPMYEGVPSWNKLIDHLYKMDYMACEWIEIRKHQTRIPA